VDAPELWTEPGAQERQTEVRPLPSRRGLEKEPEGQALQIKLLVLPSRESRKTSATSSKIPNCGKHFVVSGSHSSQTLRFSFNQLHAVSIAEEL